jgi:hypothetical protein
LEHFEIPYYFRFLFKIKSPRIGIEAKRRVLPPSGTSTEDDDAEKLKIPPADGLCVLNLKIAGVGSYPFPLSSPLPKIAKKLAF